MNVLLALASIVVLPALARSPAISNEDPPSGQPKALAEVDAYPPIRSRTRVHFFTLAGDVKAEPIRKGLAELSQGEIACRIVHGPVQAEARPNKNFVAVEAPAGVESKDVQRALKHGVGVVEELAWTCFQGADGRLGAPGERIMGFAPRDFVLGMSNDLRWVESQTGFSAFFFQPGKMSAATIADRYEKLTQPFERGGIGELVRESFTWRLAEPRDPAAAKRAEKALAKIDGVAKVAIDTALKTLSVTIALENLRVSGPTIAFPGVARPKDGEARVAGDAASAPRPVFDTTPIFAALDKEKIVVSAKDGEPASEKDAKGGG